MKINKQQLTDMVLSRLRDLETSRQSIPNKDLGGVVSESIKKSIFEAAKKKEDEEELEILQQRAHFYQEILDNIYNPEKAREMLEFLNKKIDNLKSKK